MTIALSLKINDGVVLASDSASSIIAQVAGIGGAPATGVINVYNNANKVFNLRKGKPIGAITWGSGSIGAVSISTLIKDLRSRFSGESQQHLDWTIGENYTVQQVAERLRAYVFEEHYRNAFAAWPIKPALGFIVAGYSSGANAAEEFKIDINQNGECGPPIQLRQRPETGLTWSGEPDAINRIILGYSAELPNILQNNLGVPQEQMPIVMGLLQQNLQAPVVNPAMPIQDAIDLAEFLVDLTIKFKRFAPGAPTVGGPIEIAAITKHEKFRWVRRKYYFERNLNPEDGGDDE